MLLYRFDDPSMFPILASGTSPACTASTTISRVDDERVLWIDVRRDARPDAEPATSESVTIALPLRSFAGAPDRLELELIAEHGACSAFLIELEASDCVGERLRYSFDKMDAPGRQVLVANARCPEFATSTSHDDDGALWKPPIQLHALRITSAGHAPLRLRIGLISLRVTGDVSAGRAGIA